VVIEAKSLRAAYRSKPGDVVVLDFFDYERHPVIDVVMTPVYCNTVLPKDATSQGYVTLHVEDIKFLAERASRELIAIPHGGPHVLVPFTMDGCGRLGANVQALLVVLATTALAKGLTPLATTTTADSPHAMRVSLWVQR
jgi:hypothetical protein